MVKIINANCLDGLKELPDNSVDSVVTDPPYGLSFMGKHWDYDVPQAEIWRECLRVLKPGGHLLSFFGTRTYHRGVVAIEDAGFEIRDQIGWAYGSGFPKSHNISLAIDKAAGAERTEIVGKGSAGAGFNKVKGFGENTTKGGEATTEWDIKAPATEAAKKWQGWGTALKPAWEPICVARKPFKGTVAENVMRYGTGAINIDGCRVATDELTPRNNSNTETIYKKGFEGEPKTINPSPLGRWPANLIHDGSEEVLQAFPEAPGQMAKSRADGEPMNNKIYGAMKFGTETMHPRQDGTKSAARFFYCAKASRKDREEGCEALPEKQYSHDGREKPIDNAYQRNSNSNSNSNHHPTVKPTDLMRYLVRLVTPPGGVVLDPFMGSGSTGKAAVLEGFGFIGMEREAEYCQIAEGRINFVSTKQEDLW